MVITNIKSFPSFLILKVSLLTMGSFECGVGRRSIMPLPDPKKPDEFLKVCRKCGFTVRLAKDISA